MLGTHCLVIVALVTVEVTLIGVCVIYEVVLYNQFGPDKEPHKAEWNAQTLQSMQASGRSYKQQLYLTVLISAQKLLHCYVENM